MQLAKILPLERSEHARHRGRHTEPIARPANRHPSHRTLDHMPTERPIVAKRFSRFKRYESCV